MRLTDNELSWAESRVRRLVSLASQNPAYEVEYLNSTISLSGVAKFSGEHPGTAARIQAVTDRVMAQYGLEPVEVSVERLGPAHLGLAAIEPRTIRLAPTPQLDLLLVLHECAHFVATAEHDQQFINTYVELVDRYIGPGVALVLLHQLTIAKETIDVGQHG